MARDLETILLKSNRHWMIFASSAASSSMPDEKNYFPNTTCAQLPVEQRAAALTSA
jgi:hypothetical protein